MLTYSTDPMKADAIYCQNNYYELKEKSVDIFGVHCIIDIKLILTTDEKYEKGEK